MRISPVISSRAVIPVIATSVVSAAEVSTIISARISPFISSSTSVITSASVVSISARSIKSFFSLCFRTYLRLTTQECVGIHFSVKMGYMGNRGISISQNSVNFTDICSIIYSDNNRPKCWRRASKWG